MEDKDIEARLENIYDEGWVDGYLGDGTYLDLYTDDEFPIYLGGYEDGKESIRPAQPAIGD